ncbi:hypothetical protein Tco_1330299 [Tanacetum coccineum]
MPLGWKALDDGDDVIGKLSLELSSGSLCKVSNLGSKVLGQKGLFSICSACSGYDGPIRCIHGFGYGVLKLESGKGAFHETTLSPKIKAEKYKEDLENIVERENLRMKEAVCNTLKLG